MKRALLAFVFVATAGAAPIIGITDPFITPLGNTVTVSIQFVDPIDPSPHYYRFDTVSLCQQPSDGVLCDGSGLGSLYWTVPFFSVQDMVLSQPYTFDILAGMFQFGGDGSESDYIYVREYDLGSVPNLDPASALSTTNLNIPINVSSVDNKIGGGGSSDMPEPRWFGIAGIGLVAILLINRKLTKGN